MLKRVRVVGFKSLADVTVELGPLTVLIGRSGTGKSNFVDALRFLRAFLATRDENVVEEFGGWSKVRCARPTDATRIRFEVSFAIPGIQPTFGYSLAFRITDKAGVRFSEEELCLGEEVLFAHCDNQWLTTPKLAELPDLDGRPMLGAIAGIQEITLAYWTLTTGIGCYDFPGTVFLKDSGSSQELPSGSTGLSDRGENALDVLRTLYSSIGNLPAWREMRAVLAYLNPTVKSVTTPAGARSLVVSHATDNGPLVLDLTQESGGFRRLFALLLALFQVPGKPMLVFEEPEKGLYPSTLTALAEQFKSHVFRGDSQVIVTTQSPQLLDQFQPDEIRVVELHDFATRMGPPAPDQLECLYERYLRPGELFTVDHARLETPVVPVG